MKANKLVVKIGTPLLVAATLFGSVNPLYARSFNKKPSYSKLCYSKPNCENTNTGNGSTGSGNTNTGNSTSTSTQKSFEDKVLSLVNAERAKNGLSALQMDESLRNVARLKSEDMYKNNYFSHTSPTYGSPFDMMKKFGISYRAAAENIAKGQSTPEAVVNAWMNSSGHRANILNAKYTHMGVGYVSTGNYWTQMFISK